MPERYPDDATLLAAAADPDTGVEHIPTGQSPYVLHFRRLVHRLLATARPAGDLRAYQDGDLTVGVRPGHCSIANTPLTFPGAAAVPMPPHATTHLWLDDQATLHADAALPADPARHLPLATVTTDALQITNLTDLRGRTFLRVPDPAALGLATTAAVIDRALLGASPTVTAAALNRLTAGPLATADLDHRHTQCDLTADGPDYLRLVNTSTHPTANVGLLLSVPGRLADDLALQPDPDTGLLQQVSGDQAFHLVGSTHVAFRHDGDLTATVTNQLAGAVPITGQVTAVILCVAANLQSSVGTDGVTATAKVNGVPLTTTPPTLTSAAGAGFRSTARGHGTPAVIKTDGTQLVQRGDLITLDLTRTATGSVTTQASHVAALITIRAARAE